MTMNDFKMDESLGFLVNRLATAMKHAFEKKLEKHGLTTPQYGFLFRLFEEDGQPLSSIGKTVYCDKPTITGIANRLEKKGFIIKVRDGSDKRIVKAVLTEKGKGLKESTHMTATDINAMATYGFNEDEVKILKTLLRSSLFNVLSQIEGGIINV